MGKLRLRPVYIRLPQLVYERLWKTIDNACFFFRMDARPVCLVTAQIHARTPSHLLSHTPQAPHSGLCLTPPVVASVSTEPLEKWNAVTPEFIELNKSFGFK